MLGLVLGDGLAAVGGRVPTGPSPMRSTVAGQLACTTAEGLIRASVRYRSKGICHPPAVVWHALVRWAWGQGIDAEAAYEAWNHGHTVWPDGFLSTIPVLRERRGSAPATVAALRQGGKKAGTTASAGFHGLVRTLPVALSGGEPSRLHELAKDVAALTHGARDGWLPAADGTLFLASALRTGDVRGCTEDGLRALSAVTPQHPHAVGYEAAVAEGAHAARRGAAPTRIDASRTAPAALRDALYLITAFPRRDQVLDALLFAARHGTAGTAATVGALLGACHGPDALPAELVSRLELAWVADVLAQDLVREFVDAPSEERPPPEAGTIYLDDSPDAEWWVRYPGW
ncbi:ADP-ribosylglycohydrolase family protein [Geodermatophilus sp. SYSU D00703]